MQIAGLPPQLPPARPAPSLRQDTLAVANFLTHSLLDTAERLAEKVTRCCHPHLEQEPPSEPRSPVLLAPGWSTEVDVFKPLLSKLPAPCFIKAGKFYSDSDCSHETRPGPDQKVFMMLYQDNRESPELASQEMDRALGMLGTYGKMDVVGYSMGGLAARSCLEHHQLGKVMLLSTPSHGASLIRASARILSRQIGWAIRLAHLPMTDLPAMQQMTPGSAWLNQLNSHLDQQKAAAEGLETVGGDDIWTLAGLFPRRQGDGLVLRESLELPGVNARILRHEPALLHEHAPYSVGAYREMRLFFDWA